MPLSEILRLSIESLFANKFRSALTMLGMVIGVVAVILLVSLGTGAKRYVLNEFENLGTNLIVVQPGKTDTKAAFGHPVGSTTRKMTLEDVVALEKRSFNLEAVTGLILGTATVSYEGAISNVSVFGANENFVRIINIPVVLGNFFTREEDDYGRRVVALGSKVATNLFGNEFPIGRTIKMNQSEFRVIAVMAKTGDKLGLNLDEFTLIPTRAALRLFNDDKLFGIRAKARSRGVMDDAVLEIKQILRERRDGEEDFTVITQIAMVKSMSTILNMLTYVLVAIAAISMLVGGIGIMNIMLVNVTERTQEIGIRRAVGARRVDIVKQFLSEAIMLAGLSGILGILIALSITYGIWIIVPAFDLRAPWWIVPPAFLTSLIVGSVFGVWPALKAAKIETLEALRYE